MIRMTHPTLGTHVDVPEAAVEEWAAQGWRAPHGVLAQLRAEGIRSPVRMLSPAEAAAALEEHSPATLPVTRARKPRPRTPRDDVR